MPGGCFEKVRGAWATLRACRAQSRFRWSRFSAGGLVCRLREVLFCRGSALAAAVAEMDRAFSLGRCLPAEAFDEPDRLDAGLGEVTSAWGAHTWVESCEQSSAGCSRPFVGEFRGGRRVFGELAVFFEQRVDFIFDFFFGPWVENFFRR